MYVTGFFYLSFLFYFAWYRHRRGNYGQHEEKGWEGQEKVKEKKIEEGGGGEEEGKYGEPSAGFNYSARPRGAML